MAAPPHADTSLKQFTMKLSRDHRALLVSTANDAGVTASDWVRALILLSREDHVARRSGGRTGTHSAAGNEDRALTKPSPDHPATVRHPQLHRCLRGPSPVTAANTPNRARSSLERVHDALDAAGARPRRDKADHFMAHCPLHEDRKASLSVSWVADDGGQTLLNCFSCAAQMVDILDAVGLRGSDRYDQPLPDTKKRGPRPGRRTTVAPAGNRLGPLPKRLTSDPEQLQPDIVVPRHEARRYDYVHEDGSTEQPRHPLRMDDHRRPGKDLRTGTTRRARRVGTESPGPEGAAAPARRHRRHRPRPGDLGRRGRKGRRIPEQGPGPRPWGGDHQRRRRHQLHRIARRATPRRDRGHRPGPGQRRLPARRRHAPQAHRHRRRAPHRAAGDHRGEVRCHGPFRRRAHHR